MQFQHQFRADRAYPTRIKSIEQLCRTSHPEFATSSEWGSIKQCVVKSYDDVDTSLRAHGADAYADKLADIVAKMGFD